MKPEIEDWSDLLGDRMCEAWRAVAAAVARMSGALMGGTALAVHLRHRTSYDLDYMAQRTFSGRQIAKRMEQRSRSFEVMAAETDWLQALVSGVSVQVFLTPVRGDRPGYVKPIGRSLNVSGMRVASLPDLFASKLDVIMYRPKIRDYIDIAALDSQSPYTIEDGIRFHILRYGTSPHSSTLDRILKLLEEPGTLAGNSVFEHQSDEVLSYLLDRVPAVRAHLATLRQAAASPTEAMRQRGGRPEHHDDTT